MKTDVKLAAILEQLRAREPIFHRQELGTSRRDFEQMTTEDFWEIGASGRIYDRATVLDLLEQRHQTPQVEDLQASEFRIRALAPDTYLLHYNLLQETRKTRRTTVWQLTAEGWKILFHQGTMIEGEGSPDANA